MSQTTPTPESLRRFAIAKEMYVQGYRYATRDTVANSILAIMCFDYCAETLVKAVLLDDGAPLERRAGEPRYLPELAREVQTRHTGLRYIPEIQTLHRLRNEVQHHASVPSEQEVARHRSNVRFFFDEVCTVVYGGDLSFDTISLALFVKSVVEKTLLEASETAVQRSEFDRSVYYAKRACSYHVRLMRENIGVPLRSSSSIAISRASRESGVSGFGELERAFRDIDRTLDWVTERLSLREYYDEVKALLGRWWWQVSLEPSSQEEADEIRNRIYGLITTSQENLRMSDLEGIVIFELRIVTTKGPAPSVMVGLATRTPLTECILTAVAEGQPSHEVRIEVPRESGLHLLTVPGLERERVYSLKLRAEVGDQYEEASGVTVGPL